MKGSHVRGSSTSSRAHRAYLVRLRVFHPHHTTDINITPLSCLACPTVWQMTVAVYGISLTPNLCLTLMQLIYRDRSHGSQLHHLRHEMTSVLSSSLLYKRLPLEAIFYEPGPGTTLGKPGKLSVSRSGYLQ
eukprot:scaffold38088_cov35-Attheya_sp.AAC.2